MLSSVAKLADKTFVIGFLLPALLAASAGIKVFGCPTWFDALCNTKPESPFESLTYLALGVWFLAVLLLAVNYMAYRLLEGYLPPVSWLRLVRAYHEDRFATLTAVCDRLEAAGNMTEFGAVKRELLASYPTDAAFVLPTAFGNRIRAFESYATTVYKADSIPTWSRLSAVVPPAFQAAIGDAHAQVDFFVNTLLLAVVIAATALTRFALSFAEPRTGALPADTQQLLIVAAVALAVAILAYRWAVNQIGAWGELVKSAFDCYLPALATQLGYVLPDSESERREFWVDITELFLYNYPVPEGRWKLAAAAPPKVADAGTHDGGGDD